MPETADQSDSTARVVVGGILIALAWILAAATVVTLLIVLPDHQVDDYAWAVVLCGMGVAASATHALIDYVIN